MNRMKIALMGTAMILTACNTGSVAASTAGIPAAYHGTYSETAQSCAMPPAQDYDRLVLSTNRMEVDFHDGVVIDVVDDMQSGRANGIVVTIRATIEGRVMEMTRALRKEPGSTSIWLQTVPRPVGPGEPPPPPGVSAPQMLVRCST